VHQVEQLLRCRSLRKRYPPQRLLAQFHSPALTQIDR